MTLLEEFVFALSKTQRAKLRPLQFRGIKRKIFLKILNCRSRNGIDTTTILRSLSKHRYYQMLSEMLAACYRDVAPRGGIELIQFLGNNQLFRHLYSELKRQEAAVLKKGDKKALERYYFDVLLTAHFFTIPYEGKATGELHQYLERYIECKNFDPSDKYLHRVAEIRKQVSQLSTAFKKEVAQGYFGELVTIFDKVKTTDAFLVTFIVTYLLVSYSGRLVQNRQEALYYLKYARRLFDRHTERFGNNRKFFELYLDVERARLTESPLDIRHHKASFATLPKSIGFPLHSMYRLFPLILDAGDFQLAKSYIQKYFPLKIELVCKEMARFYWDLLMLYYIYQKRYSEAEHCLRHTLQINTGKGRNVTFELYLRRFEIFLTGMRGDPVLMEHLIKKRNRYALAHGHFRTPLMNGLSSLIKYIGVDPVRAQAVRENYLLSKNEPVLHHLIFERIYTKYFPQNILKTPSS